jgi:FlaG/FlaF family flagellin (archaellin)
MQEAAQAYGWTYVGGIDEQFSRWGEDSQGYCSDTSWMRTMVESNRLQGPESYEGEAWHDIGLWSPQGGTTGTMHPNTIGHGVYKTAILNAISGAPSPGPTFAASEPEYAPGRVVVRVTATDPSGVVSESVSVNATGACQVEGVTCTARRPNRQSLEWTIEVTKEGLHTFDFRATDGDGQESSFVHEVEFLPPAPPIINGPTDNSYETDGSLTFFGTTEAGSKISLFEEGNPEPVGSSTADGSGAWSITLTGVGNGSHTYTAKATNISGLTSVASEPVRVSVDTQAPKVTSTVPAANATGVKRNTNLTATFSEKMDPSTLTTLTFKLFKVNPDGSTTQITNVTVTPSTDGLKATLNPFGTSTTLLAKSTKYKAIVTTGAKDVAGNLLDQNSTTSGNQQMAWSFKTGLQ